MTRSLIGTGAFARCRPVPWNQAAGAAIYRMEAAMADMTRDDLAYRILGSRADAEDVVQDCFLRWSAIDRPAVRLQDIPPSITPSIGGR